MMPQADFLRAVVPQTGVVFTRGTDFIGHAGREDFRSIPWEFLAHSLTAEGWLGLYAFLQNRCPRTLHEFL